MTSEFVPTGPEIRIEWREGERRPRAFVVPEDGSALVELHDATPPDVDKPLDPSVSALDLVMGVNARTR